ncbi:hypothetical protein [Desulfosarcina cetonica]|uniref:hypothetical protein n=1 Tax=Desulfosarcina cetonica TaxID=90730 RepID=UPI001C4504DB|nr:hypothetical protein [Desulfosarcina cetonica]
MLSLDSPKWSELKHAYGFASDIPALLRQLESLPSSEGNDEPWFSLWSALAHQGDVYPASFAAVPYVVNAISKSPLKAGFTYFQFPAWVEICRKKNSVPIPEELEADYFIALKQLPQLVAEASGREWDDTFLACALSVIAAAKGFHNIAEAVLEIDSEVADGL